MLLKFGQGLVGQVGNAIKGIADDVFSANGFMSLLRGGGLPSIWNARRQLALQRRISGKVHRRR